MKIDIHSIAGEVVGSTELDASIWTIEPNIGVMHQALLMQLANARQGTHDTKTRAEVRGGGRKPWRQKGTGRARQGSIRSPQWVGGGVVWGPHPRKYTQRLPKKMRHLAVRSALSAKLRDERLVVVQGLGGIEPRTKVMKGILEKFPASRSVLIVISESSDGIERAASNLENVRTIRASYLNVRDVLKYDRLMVTEESLAIIETWLALPSDRREPSRWKLERLARKAGAAGMEA
ncbi:MAG: 50S ribosomal protein L4 [Thermomicrobiales bacterium]